MSSQTTPASQVDAAYGCVRSAVLSGELAAGAVTSQVAIGRRFGLGRTPLREALRLLQREGLIEAEHFQRIRIAPFSIPDLEDLYAQRIVCEALAVRVTVPELDTADRDGLRNDLEHLDDLGARRNYREWDAVHRRFHGRLVAHAGGRLRGVVSELADHAERYRRFYLQQAPIAWESGRRDHRAIVDACNGGDAQLAGVELARHLARTALAVAAIAAPEHEPARVRTALNLIAPDGGRGSMR